MKTGKMKSYYYYERDEKKRPVVTHCLLAKFEGDELKKVAKGITKCSDMDSPWKKRGRDIAFARATQAFTNDCSQMDKGKLFWKKLSHDLVFSHLTEKDKRLLQINA